MCSYLGTGVLNVYGVAGVNGSKLVKTAAMEKYQELRALEFSKGEILLHGPALVTRCGKSNIRLIVLRPKALFLFKTECADPAKWIFREFLPLRDIHLVRLEAEAEKFGDSTALDAECCSVELTMRDGSALSFVVSGGIKAESEKWVAAVSGLVNAESVDQVLSTVVAKNVSDAPQESDKLLIDEDYDHDAVVMAPLPVLSTTSLI